MTHRNKPQQKKALPAKFQIWVEARKRFRLSDGHVQMARELGLNPKKLGGLANHDQERWKSPLQVFIEELYFKSFGRERPEIVMSIEQIHEMRGMKRQNRVSAMEQTADLNQNTAENDEDDDKNPF